MGEKKLEIKEPEGAEPKYAWGASYEFPSRCDGRAVVRRMVEKERAKPSCAPGLM